MSAEVLDEAGRVIGVVEDGPPPADRRRRTVYDVIADTAITVAPLYVRVVDKDGRSDKAWREAMSKRGCDLVERVDAAGWRHLWVRAAGVDG